MASTLSTFDFALKERYTNKDIVENLIFSDRPLLSEISKDEEFQGDVMPIPLVYGAPQGISGGGLSVAQTNKTNVAGVKFPITVGTYEAAVDIGDKVIKASRANPGAFLQNKTTEIDNLYEQMADNLAVYAWGNGGGALGQQSGAISGETITLVDPAQAVNFEVGMWVISATDDGSAGADNTQGVRNQVTAIDRATGVITFEDASDLASADGDFLFREGDYRGLAQSDILYGIQAWLPGTASPGTLFGVTRTTDVQRLAGCYVPSADLVGKDIEESIQLLGAYMTGRFKGPGPTKAYMHPEDWQNLAISLQSRGQRPAADSSTKFGYQALEVVMGGKLVKILPDRFAPRSLLFALRMQNWKLTSMLKLIHPLNGDGLTMLRASDANNYEYRLVSYPQVYTNAPGWSGRVTLPS